MDRLTSERGGDIEAPPLVELQGVHKQFGATAALTDIDFVLRAGEVHALLGENGAGKSTLGKVLGGVYSPDAGIMTVDGAGVRLRRPADALRLGITVMQQEIALAPDLSVMENVLLGQYPARLGLVDRKQQRRRFDALLERSGFELPRDLRAGALPLALQQQVEILRALARDARVIVMDEPTAALSAAAADELHAIVRDLASHGVAIVYVSHFLEDALALSDQVTVLRGGRIVNSCAATEATVDQLVESMLGRTLSSTFPSLAPIASTAPVRLDVRGLTVMESGTAVDLRIRAGEVVGLFGLMGSGRSELAHAIFGAAGPVEGELYVDGSRYHPWSPTRALATGIGLLPESRKDQGLFLDHSQLRNTVATALPECASRGILRPKRELARARRALNQSAVSNNDPRLIVSTLSGGNQQKVLLAKTLYGNPKILILDEPTRGVDVGARRAIYEALVALAERGMAILLISSDLEEADQMSHRLCVMREGSKVAEYPSGQASHGEILNAAFGITAAHTTEMETLT